MAGERLDAAALGWHGLEGDRRLAFRRIHDRSGFPWLSASQLPAMVLFTPHRSQAAESDLPTHVRTPEGTDIPVFSEELDAEIGRRSGAPVQLTHWKHGIFDEASVSVIALETVDEISRLARVTPDVRRFRPNLLVRAAKSVPFQEDAWVGGLLRFGGSDDAPAVAVTMRDLRCAMLNLDPDTATPTPEMMKAVVRVHGNTAGVYGAVTRTGRLEVGQSIFLSAATSKQERRS